MNEMKGEEKLNSYLGIKEFRRQEFTTKNSSLLIN